MPPCHPLVPRFLAASILATLVLFMNQPALADLEAARRAFDAQDYETAYREAQPLAERGDEYAQRIAKLAKLMIDLKRLRDEHRAVTGPIDLRDYDGRYRPARSKQDQARFDRGQRNYDDEAYEAAFREWLPLADAGDAEAEFMISLLYSLGRGIAEDPEKADSYLLRAAERGYGPAQSHMPQLFDLDPWDDATDREGFHWAMRAAANGQIGAYFALSSAYCHGNGTDKNPVLADIWLYLATPDKDEFLDRNCVDDVEWPTSYYEAIAERAEAMRQAYDIPMAAMTKPAEVEGGDAVDGPR